MRANDSAAAAKDEFLDEMKERGFYCSETLCLLLTVGLLLTRVPLPSCHPLAAAASASFTQPLPPAELPLRGPTDSGIIRGGIFGVRCGEIWMISSSILPRFGRVSVVIFQGKI